MPLIPTGSAGDVPLAKKRVSPKTATKKAAQVPAKKVPAVKKVAAPKKTTAVKKAAVVKKVATPKITAQKAALALTPELPFASPAMAKPLAIAPAALDNTPPPVRSTRAKKIVTEAIAPAPQIQDSEQAPRRIGRVPGGGPIAGRNPVESPSVETPASTPFPQTIRPPVDREPPATASSSLRDSSLQERGPQNGQARNPQTREGHSQRENQTRENQGPPGDSRSKRRRDKRKRRNGERQEQSPQGPPRQAAQANRNRHDSGAQQARSNDSEDRRQVSLSGPKIETNGLLELAPKGFGFLRIPGKNFEQARDDIFVSPEIIRKYNLRLGQWLHGLYQDGPRGPQLAEVTQVNDLPPAEASKLPHFDELKAINPSRRISFETTPTRFTTRVVDIMAPVGRGQRGLIVSPPRSGKTTLLLHMAEAIREKYDEAIHLMVVLVDERPEEVTEFRRALPGAEIYASSNDEPARSHTRIAEIAIERAKRLVEAGKDVFLIMDSITRLARAYNGNMNNRGRGTASGGLTIGALEVPRRLFAAARNTRGGGSLTIMATALIQTNSRADEAIYMEFKGTGNMELVLDRKIAENYIYPAVDIFKSGTRREELLLADHMLHKIHLIRRGLSGHRPAEAMERLLFFLKKFPNNPQMLLEIKG